MNFLGHKAQSRGSHVHRISRISNALCQLPKGKKSFEKKEIGDKNKPRVTENLGPVFKSAVNMLRLKNILRKRFRSEENLATEKEKQEISIS